jgi:hypothetical protein
MIRAFAFQREAQIETIETKHKAYTTETRAQATTTDAINRPRASTYKEFGSERTGSDSIDDFGGVRDLLIVKSAG